MTRIFAVLPLSIVLLASSAFGGDVTILVSGVQPGGGPIRVGAFASQSDFDSDRDTQGASAPASGTQVSVVLSGLPPGTYAIAVFQDDDDDEAISTSFLGIPKESFGFSNGARGRFGPPDFDEMSVTVTDAPLTLEVMLE